MKDKICIFAGTTEGRKLAALLCDAVELTICVATEYGEVLLDGIDGIAVHTGRMDADEMKRFFEEKRFCLVIDATHPYAAAVTENIAVAAKNVNLPLMRILRETQRAVPDAVYVDSVGAARDFLEHTEGNILLTTGSKELAGFTGLDMDRVWARVLPLAASLEACAAAGVPAAHIIAAQGPFSYEMNLAQLRAIHAKYLVTKASGKNGGFDEKIAAAKTAGAVPVIIGAPPQTEGVTLEEAITALEKVYPIRKRAVTVVGIGPGGRTYLTEEAKKALAACDAVIGAKSVTDVLAVDQPVFAEYLPQKVRETLRSHPSVRRAAVVMRGDTGFFSGAKKLVETLREENDVTVIPGVASPVLLAAKLGVSWEDAAFLSLHGRNGNLLRTAARNEKTFVLSDRENAPEAICETLCAYGMGGLYCAVGERLSYPEESVARGTAEELKNRTFDPLSVVYIENPYPEKGLRSGIPDGEFLRGNVPMTKAEIRAVSMAKLSLDSNSVVWDIGAGTGSVSVECALAAYDGTVFAVEKNPEGVKLIRENAVRFKTDNLSVVEGAAPEALTDLPKPTHVFIGGSGGSLKEIVSLILQKNSHAVIVLNAVTLETQAEALECCKALPLQLMDAMQVGVTKTQKMGRYHLTAAQNPVWIFTLRGGENHD